MVQIFHRLDKPEARAMPLGGGLSIGQCNAFTCNDYRCHSSRTVLGRALHMCVAYATCSSFVHVVAAIVQL